MLTLTENASTVVKTIVEQSETDQQAGLRISQDAVDSPALHVIATEAPQPGDQVLEEDGARVFLEETAAETLDDKVLDAQVDDNGGVQFTHLRAAGRLTPPPHDGPRTLSGGRRHDVRGSWGLRSRARRWWWPAGADRRAADRAGPARELPARPPGGPPNPPGPAGTAGAATVAGRRQGCAAGTAERHRRDRGGGERAQRPNPGCRSGRSSRRSCRRVWDAHLCATCAEAGGALRPVPTGSTCGRAGLSQEAHRLLLGFPHPAGRCCWHAARELRPHAHPSRRVAAARPRRRRRGQHRRADQHGGALRGLGARASRTPAARRSAPPRTSGPTPSCST